MRLSASHYLDLLSRIAGILRTDTVKGFFIELSAQDLAADAALEDVAPRLLS